MREMWREKKSAWEVFIKLLRVEGSDISCILLSFCVCRLYGLVRWQEGTCHFAPQLKSSSSGSIHRFSFVEDLIQCPEVKSVLDHIYETISLVTEEIGVYIER